MQVQIKYFDLVDRARLIEENEAKGLRMLCDNFDNPDWKAGDPMAGTMTFTDEPPPVTPITPPRDLASEIDALTVRVVKLESSIRA